MFCVGIWDNLSRKLLYCNCDIITANAAARSAVGNEALRFACRPGVDTPIVAECMAAALVKAGRRDLSATMHLFVTFSARSTPASL